MPKRTDISPSKTEGRGFLALAKEGSPAMLRLPPSAGGATEFSPARSEAECWEQTARSALLCAVSPAASFGVSAALPAFRLPRVSPQFDSLPAGLKLRPSEAHGKASG